MGARWLLPLPLLLLALERCAADRQLQPLLARARRLARQEPEATAICSGGQCTLDQMPLLRRMADEARYPAECSRRPPLADLLQPLSQLSPPAGLEKDCYLNYYPACTAAKRAGDYAAYALATATLMPFFESDERDLGGFRTAKGVSPLEAKLCVEHGFIDLPKDLLLNATALEAEVDRHCQWLDSQFPGFGDTIAWAAFYGVCAYEGGWFPPGAINLDFTTREEMLKHEIWKCHLGRHALACDMAECIYNFCRLPDGRVATGKNCRQDWLDPTFVEEHYWPAFRGP